MKSIVGKKTVHVWHTIGSGKMVVCCHYNSKGVMYQMFITKDGCMCDSCWPSCSQCVAIAAGTKSFNGDALTDYLCYFTI